MNIFFSFVAALHLILVFGAAIRILLREELSSSSRLAWFIVIVTLPVFGLIVYILFGDVRLNRRLRHRHRTIADEIRQSRAPYLGTSAQLVPEKNRAASKYSTSINGFGPLGGNAVDLLPDAETTLAHMVAEIDGAKHSVNVIYYIWLTDHTGTQIAEALMRAVARGVKCRAAADNLGSRRLIKSDLWKDMINAGVDARIAMPYETVLRVPLITRFDLRNHRKLTIIDGQTVFLGSQNCADPEFAPKRAFGPWIDIMFRFEGPIANQAQLLFASDWMLISDETLDDFHLRGTPQPSGVLAQLRGTGPLERHGSAAQMFCTLFEHANNEIIITTPYFVPDISVVNALTSAALRGVKVLMILPKRNDSWIVRAASVGFYSGLLKHGVQIFEHGPGLLHAKTLTIDGETAFFGSSNLDLRSFDLNFENDVLLMSPHHTGLIRERQLLYLSQSTQVDAEKFSKLPIRKRLFNNIISTMGPVL